MQCEELSVILNFFINNIRHIFRKILQRKSRLLQSVDLLLLLNSIWMNKIVKNQNWMKSW